MASRPPPPVLQLKARRQLSPNMLRLTLGGSGMADFPGDQAGGYVKLRLDDGAQGGKPVLRTYTIRAQRPDAIDIDFVLHRTSAGEVGPATEWAMGAAVGVGLPVGGPGPAKPLPPGHDFYIIAGDMTALPAIGVNLEALDRSARGMAFIEIQDPADAQEIAAPPGMDIHWLCNRSSGTQPDLLVDALRRADWPADRSYGWAACEFQSMRRLREYLRGASGMTSDRLYISSYWKSGLDEEAHKQIKREDAEHDARE